LAEVDEARWTLDAHEAAHAVCSLRSHAADGEPSVNALLDADRPQGTAEMRLDAAVLTRLVTVRLATARVAPLQLLAIPLWLASVLRRSLQARSPARRLAL
jgi:hypothetical protein